MNTFNCIRGCSFFLPLCPFFATSLYYRLPLACGESERKKGKRFTSSYIRKTRVNNASETTGNKREVTLKLSPGNEVGATNSPIPICAGIMGENKFFFIIIFAQRRCGIRPYITRPGMHPPTVGRERAAGGLCIRPKNEKYCTNIARTGSPRKAQLET